ncbi:MAG TPA: hypothetical protein VMW75_26695 [Thermoanaerobaculia bacterium]|nr:hypothetical protein [Thermoanaerobaculia bacterium]
MLEEGNLSAASQDHTSTERWLEIAGEFVKRMGAVRGGHCKLTLLYGDSGQGES